MVVILWAAKSSVNTFVQVNSYKWAFYELCGTIFVSTLHNTGHELKEGWKNGGGMDKRPEQPYGGEGCGFRTKDTR